MVQELLTGLWVKKTHDYFDARSAENYVFRASHNI
jgi:hypothetical protein